MRHGHRSRLRRAVPGRRHPTFFRRYPSLAERIAQLSGACPSRDGIGVAGPLVDVAERGRNRSMPLRASSRSRARALYTLRWLRDYGTTFRLSLFRRTRHASTALPPTLLEQAGYVDPDVLVRRNRPTDETLELVAREFPARTNPPLRRTAALPMRTTAALRRRPPIGPVPDPRYRGPRWHVGGPRCAP